MTGAVTAGVLDVLLVEDDSGDVLLAQEAFAQSAISSRLHVARDGEQAIGFLRRTGPYASAPRAGLILLDLNLPRMDGRSNRSLSVRSRLADRFATTRRFGYI